ncbi:MAG: SAM-dependent methyltransferase [Actinomycetota bacterium]|nr:SAM-dependent methyltransferase [Actinomycetota bacterium]
MIGKDKKKYLIEKYKSKSLYFDQFMEESLYSKYGFFNNEKTRSKKTGDFLTSPEVSEYFGNLIENWIEVNNIRGTLLELGSGTGSLIKNFTDEKKSRLLAVERSATARKELQNLGIQIVDSPSKLKNQTIDLIFGNEILDNIPCSIAIYKNNKWFEKGVDISNENFRYELLSIRDKNKKWLTSNNISGCEEFEIEVQTNIQEFIIKLIKNFQPNNFMFFDYGYFQKERINKKYTSLLRTYKNHHLAGDPILNFGEVDITYDINFSALQNLFIEYGYKASIITQKKFLESCGAVTLLKTLKNLKNSSEGLEQLKLQDKILGLETILNLNGLGGFYVLNAKKV